MEKETLKVKAQVNENITFEWKAVGQWLWWMAFKWKQMEKGVSGPSTQESLS